MDETRAIASLPHLDIQIRHRRLPEEQSAQLAISLRATPSFKAFAHFLDRQGSWPCSHRCGSERCPGKLAAMARAPLGCMDGRSAPRAECRSREGP
jgi:hypothetical protein